MCVREKIARRREKKRAPGRRVCTTPRLRERKGACLSVCVRGTDCEEASQRDKASK